MRQFLREVARGPRASRNLTYEESLEAARLIFNETTSPIQIAAFFTAERMMGESPEEIQAFVEVLRELTNAVSIPNGGVLDCAGPYDGRSKSFFSTLPVAMVLATAGVPVLLHSSRTLPPKFGVTVTQVAADLGLSVSTDPQSLQRQLQDFRFACADTEAFCRPLQVLRSLREQLGFRTLLNTAEKFVNVGRADFAVAGVFHGKALDTASQVVARLGYKRAMVVQGVDGSEDLPMHRASALTVLEHGVIQEFRIHPQDYGLETPLVPISLSAMEQATLVSATLSGEDGRYRNATILNSALRLWLTGRCDTIEQGVMAARDILDSGKAWQTFCAIRKQAC